MKTEKILYQAKECETESGYEILFYQWVVERETPCYYFCVDARYKDLKITQKIKKIHKTCSRFAFDTKQKALDNLIIKKKHQLWHAVRAKAVIGELLKHIEGKKVDDFKAVENQYYNRIEAIEIPGTKEIVNEWFIFD